MCELFVTIYLRNRHSKQRQYITAAVITHGPALNSWSGGMIKALQRQLHTVLSIWISTKTPARLLDSIGDAAAHSPDGGLSNDGDGTFTGSRYRPTAAVDQRRRSGYRWWARLERLGCQVMGVLASRPRRHRYDQVSASQAAAVTAPSCHRS